MTWDYTRTNSIYNYESGLQVPKLNICALGMLGFLAALARTQTHDCQLQSSKWTGSVRLKPRQPVKAQNFDG